MNRPIFLLILLSMILISCSSMKVMVKYDDEVNFEDYKTYKFVQPKHRQKQSVKDPFFKKETIAEIRPLMEAKGFQEAETIEEADLLLHFYAYVKNQSDYMPPTYHRGRWGRVHRVSPGHVVHYKTGTLVIDMVDAKQKELVWQGVGKGVLDRYNPATDLVKAVNEVLKAFPPKTE